MTTKDELVEPLSKISMVCANFRNGEMFEKVMLDWFEFIGGRPGEVVVVDGGSDIKTHEMYFNLLKKGMIDKLQLIRTDHPDNSRETCYIQETQAGAFTSKPYLLFWKSDTLPYERGHAGWIKDALAQLEREDIFAVGGSFNVPSKHHEAWPGWYFSDKCSLNFCLMKRESFMAAIEEYAGEFIRSGFRSPNPGIPTGQERYVVEVAFERYIERHKKYTLVKVEEPTWTVFHTNTFDQDLEALRAKYRGRIDIKRYMNAGQVVKHHGGCFYGRRRSLLEDTRIALGRWRRIAAWKLFGTPTGLPERKAIEKAHAAGGRMEAVKSR